MRKIIIERLKELEKENDVKILFAIESGSRAWEFHSKDSDYDVRCIHVSNLDSYLGLKDYDEQIDFLDGELDIVSWDIRKFGRLFIESNPQIAEWLRSPIVYIDSPIRKKFLELFDKSCDLDYLQKHYVSMSKQNFHKYIESGLTDSCKKYLYVLRAIGCSEYIKKKRELPPLPYSEVIKYLPNDISKFFEKCVVAKEKSEKTGITNQSEIMDYIRDYLKKEFTKQRKPAIYNKELNDYIIQIIKKH